MPDTEALKRNYMMLHRLISEGTVVSGYALGFGGLTEALAKMSFGNRIGAEVRVKDSDLFNYGNGSILVESKEILELPDFELIGETTGNEHLKVNDAAISIDEAFEANRKHFTAVYPDRTSVCGKVEKCRFGRKTPQNIKASAKSILWFISRYSPAQTATTTWLPLLSEKARK